MAVHILPFSGTRIQQEDAGITAELHFLLEENGPSVDAWTRAHRATFYRILEQKIDDLWCDETIRRHPKSLWEAAQTPPLETAIRDTVKKTFNQFVRDHHLPAYKPSLRERLRFALNRNNITFPAGFRTRALG